MSTPFSAQYAQGDFRPNAYSMASFDGDGLPVDKRAASYRIMVLLGCGLLLPWNAVLTAFAYFQDLYHDNTFEFGVPLSNQVTNFFMLIVMIKYGSRWSFTRRIVAMFVVYFLLLIMLPPLGMLVGAGHKDLGLWLTYACFAGFGASCAVLQSSLFGFAGLLPPDYTQAIMAGQGISGVFMNVLMMICQAGTEQLPGDDAASIEAWLFFGLAAVVVFVCIFAYLAMVRQRFIRWHVPDVDEIGTPLTREEEEAWAAATKAEMPDFPPSPAEPVPPGRRSAQESNEKIPKSRSWNSLAQGAEANPLSTERKYASLSHDDRANFRAQEDSIESPAPSNASPVGYSFTSMFDSQLPKKGAAPALPPGGGASSLQHNLLGSQMDSSANEAAATSPRDEVRDLDLHIPRDDEGSDDLDTKPAVDTCKVFRSIWYYALSVFGLFLVSLLIFPGFLTVTCAKGPFKPLGESWYRLVLVTTFNVADLSGRVVAPSLISFIPHRSLSVVALVRIALVPLFYAFVYDSLAWWWGPLVFTFVLGLSNGFFGAICMMHGPSKVEPHEREMAGTLMAFCLMMGIIGGAGLQLGVAQFFKADDIGTCS